jgi:hypothetical protein
MLHPVNPMPGLTVFGSRPFGGGRRVRLRYAGKPDFTRAIPINVGDTRLQYGAAKPGI